MRDSRRARPDSFENTPPAELPRQAWPVLGGQLGSWQLLASPCNEMFPEEAAAANDDDDDDDHGGEDDEDWEDPETEEFDIDFLDDEGHGDPDITIEEL